MISMIYITFLQTSDTTIYDDDDTNDDTFNKFQQQLVFDSQKLLFLTGKKVT